MSQSKKPEWEVRLNVDGAAIMIARTSKESAQRIAASFGMKLEGNFVTRWPLTISKIGSRVELEQKALAQILAPKLEVHKGDLVIILSGHEKVSDNAPKEMFMPLTKAIKRIYEALEGKSPMHWTLSIAEPGTIITR